MISFHVCQFNLYLTRYACSFARTTKPHFKSCCTLNFSFLYTYSSVFIVYLFLLYIGMLVVEVFKAISDHVGILLCNSCFCNAIPVQFYELLVIYKWGYWLTSFDEPNKSVVIITYKCTHILVQIYVKREYFFLFLRIASISLYEMFLLKSRKNFTR